MRTAPRQRWVPTSRVCSWKVPGGTSLITVWRRHCPGGFMKTYHRYDHFYTTNPLPAWLNIVVIFYLHFGHGHCGFHSLYLMIILFSISLENTLFTCKKYPYFFTFILMQKNYFHDLNLCALQKELNLSFTYLIVAIMPIIKLVITIMMWGVYGVPTDLAAANDTQRDPEWAKLLLSCIQDEWEAGNPYHHRPLHQLCHLCQPTYTPQPGPLGAERRGTAVLPFRLSFVLDFIHSHLYRCHPGSRMCSFKIKFLPYNWIYTQLFYFLHSELTTI